MDQQINNSQPLDHSKLNPYHTFKMKPLQSMCIHVHQLKSSPQNYKRSPPTVEVASYAFKLFSKLEDNITKQWPIYSSQLYELQLILLTVLFSFIRFFLHYSSVFIVFIYHISYITVLSIHLSDFLHYSSVHRVVTVNLYSYN